jgi:membrane protein DedA with SNARE-associated domain
MHIILIYIGLFLGIFVEGEMIMISSIIAAHHGYLNLWLVVIIGVLGTYSSDVFYFMLGRKKGKEWLNKNQKIKQKVQFVDHKIERYPILIFIIYRFLYGFRTVTPLVIGASGTKTGTFLFYCGLSTAIWAGTYCTIGYMFGALIKSKLGHIEHIEKYIIAGIVFIAIVVIVINALKMRRQRLTYL